MRGARRFLRRRARAAAVFVRARVGGWLAADELSSVRGFCAFVGYPRSGHTLLAALLDAHPAVAIGHEHTAFAMVLDGTPRDALFSELRRSARLFSARGAASGSGQSYRVPGQWQGRHRTLAIVGIQRGGKASRVVLKHPDLFERLRRTVGVPLRVVHAVRHPYDNISSIQRFEGVGLPEAIEVYFRCCAAVAAASRALAPDEMFELRHEDFVADPRAGLAALCRFLGVDADAAYLDACAAIVYKSPHLSRREAPWTPPLQDEVRRRAAEFPFLVGYSLA